MLRFQQCWRKPPRRRGFAAHRLIHEQQEDPTQRLVIAAVAGTYVRPHVHPEQWEVLALLSGSGRLFEFAPDGTVLAATELSAAATPVVQIPAGRWHGFVVSGDHAVVLEVKQGPYRPSVFADWAPEEGAADAPDCVRWLGVAEQGDLFQAGQSA